MDEIWERAVETALDEQTGGAGARSLTLDGAVKCVQGRLPPPELLERFQSLEHLSIANVGVSSLEKFPRLPNLQKLILSDNRIAGGLEFLVSAGLASLRDLDLSNNRIQFVEDLAPLAQLKLVSLDLYECPVTRVKDYRSNVFGLIRSLKYLDKMDADENERPESEDEEDDDEEDDEEEDDPGSGEVDGEDRLGKSMNGGASEGILDVDEDDESDADEEESEAVRSRIPNGSNHGGGASVANELSNGFRVASTAGESNSVDGDEEDVEDEDEDDLVEEIDEGDNDGVVEVHEIDESNEDEDGIEEDDDEDDDDNDDIEDDEEYAEPGSTGRLTSVEGEIDGHDQGEESENGEIGDEEEQGIEEDVEYEEDDEENGDDDNGEIGDENEQGVDEDCEYEEEDGDGEDEEEDFGSEYLVQPIGQVQEEAGGSDLDPGNDDEAGEEEVEDEDDRHRAQPQPPQLKRRRDSNSNDSDGIEDPRPLKDSKHH